MTEFKWNLWDKDSEDLRRLEADIRAASYPIFKDSELNACLVFDARAPDELMQAAFEFSRTHFEEMKGEGGYFEACGIWEIEGKLLYPVWFGKQGEKSKNIECDLTFGGITIDTDGARTFTMLVDATEDEKAFVHEKAREAELELSIEHTKQEVETHLRAGKRIKIVVAKTKDA